MLKHSQGPRDPKLKPHCPTAKTCNTCNTPNRYPKVNQLKHVCLENPRYQPFFSQLGWQRSRRYALSGLTTDPLGERKISLKKQ